LCYPAHATHIYQGLDVAVFGVLKQCWAEERDQWEREKGEEVTKKNFLGIYGAAHVRALTHQTIQSAFRKTGVCPYNPLSLPSPLRAITQLFREQLNDYHTNNDLLSIASHSAHETLRGMGIQSSTIHDAIRNLENTSARFLISSSPFKKPRPVSTTSRAFPASMNREQKLQKMVNDLTAQVACLKEQVIGLQATVVLQGLYCDRVRQHQ